MMMDQYNRRPNLLINDRYRVSVRLDDIQVIRVFEDDLSSKWTAQVYLRHQPYPLEIKFKSRVDAENYRIEFEHAVRDRADWLQEAVVQA